MNVNDGQDSMYPPSCSELAPVYVCARKKFLQLLQFFVYQIWIGLDTQFYHWAKTDQ